MARLFITPREMNFINDIAKEVIKFEINALKTLNNNINDPVTNLTKIMK